MGLFELPNIPNSKQKDKHILKKSTMKVPKSIKGSQTLADKIIQIKAEVNTKLADYKEEYQCVRDEVMLKVFIDHCIEQHGFNRVVAIDTETTGLDPMLDDIVGFSLYTPRIESNICSNKSCRLHNKK